MIYSFNSNYSPSSAQNRPNNKMIKNIMNKNNNNCKNKDLNDIIKKGDNLKKRTRDLLNKYINLSNQIRGINNKKNNN